MSIVRKSMANTLIDVQSSPVKHITQDFGIERHGHQLPPPFYPAGSCSIPDTTALNESEDGSTTSAPSTFFQYPLDRTIVFGGYVDSDRSSPTPPQSAASTVFAQPTPPSDVPSSPAQSTYQGYGHVKRVRRRSVTSTPPKLTDYPYDFPSSQQVYVPLTYGYGVAPNPYDTQTPLMPGGSQPPFTPSATPFRDHSLQYSGPIQGTMFDARYTPTSQLIKVVEERQHTIDVESTTALVSHLYRNFDVPEYADCVLEIQVGRQFASLRLHALLIGRSPTIRTLFDSATGFTETGRNQLSLRTSDQFVTIPAIVSALQVFYGKSPTDLTPGLNWAPILDSERADGSSSIDFALAYTAAGFILQIPEVINSGVDVVVSSLSLNILEKVLTFALDGFARPTNGSARRNSLSEDENKDALTFDYGTYAPYSGRVLEATLQFLVLNFPTDFLLDVTAPTLKSLCDSLTAEQVQQSVSSSRSRLSCIQFGDFPSEISEPPSAENTLLSSILFSVPFLVLEHVLDHLEQSVSQRLSEPITKERERRRDAALASGSSSMSRDAK